MSFKPDDANAQDEICMLDSWDTCGQKLYPYRKSCGLKNNYPDTCGQGL